MLKYSNTTGDVEIHRQENTNISRYILTLKTQGIRVRINLTVNRELFKFPPNEMYWLGKTDNKGGLIKTIENHNIYLLLTHQLLKKNFFLNYKNNNYEKKKTTVFEILTSENKGLGDYALLNGFTRFE